MQLSIGERLSLMMILPREGDFLSLKTVRGLREALSESLRQDAEAGALKNDDGRYSWANEQDHEVDIAIDAKGAKIIRERLEQLDKQKKLTEQHISLYERFLVDVGV